MKPSKDLDEQIEEIFANMLKSIATSAITGDKRLPADYVMDTKQQLLPLIEQYAYEYAKSVVGEDEVHRTKAVGMHPLPLFYVRDKLRTEQHNRNDQLRGRL